jgi:hypothetical protein
MTEAQWLVCKDSIVMLGLRKITHRSRKLRLFAVACCRRIEKLMTEPSDRSAVSLAERYADGEATAQALADSLLSANANALRNPRDTSYERACALAAGSTLMEDATLTAAQASHWVRYVSRADEGTTQATMLRDIFGNPFHPVAFSPEWRTDTAVALARQMYDSRDFSAMPILADALQDAGCASADILDHCRDAALTHVRGCWVCDLVLDKA